MSCATKIENCANALSGLGGRVSHSDWALIRSVIAELKDAAETAGNLERLPVDTKSLVCGLIGQRLDEFEEAVKNGFGAGVEEAANNG